MAKRYIVKACQKAVFKECSTYFIEVPDGVDVNKFIQKSIQNQDFKGSILDADSDELFQVGDSYDFDIDFESIREGGYDR